VDVFSALADPIRRALLEQVAAGPARVVDLAADHPISRPAVSKHLRVLTESGLVVAHDHGRERHYALVPGALGPVVGFLEGLALGGSPVTTHVLDALDTEVRRAGRDRRTTAPTRRETA
jgi:DNA-binding transcriptional ArsR family regulator